MESDGIEDAFEGQLRVLITAAGQAGERFARAREEMRRKEQATSEQAARELRSRLAGEQQAARAELSNVHRADWWVRATPEEIGHAYQVARAWTNEDPEAGRAEQLMRDELRTRYGVDVDNTDADPSAVRAAVERASQERAQAEAEHNRAIAEKAEAQRLMTLADQEDRRGESARAAAEHEPDPVERVAAILEVEQSAAKAERAGKDGGATYDSSERRESASRELEAKGINHEVVATRIRADVGQAQPATEAVKDGGKGRRVPKVSKRRGVGRERVRSGLER